MLRCFVIASLVLLASPAQASDLGADGQLQFSANAITTLDFENAAQDATRLFRIVGGAQTWSYASLTASDLQAFLVTEDAAPQGQSYLHWRSSNGEGLAFIDPATFGAVTGSRINVSFWGRSEGMEPFVAVTYGNAEDLPSNKTWAWARIPAIRTGRETSDGWVEYATNAIDGSILGRPIHDIVLSARVPTSTDTNTRMNSKSTYPTDAMSIDALEITPAAGAPLNAPCTELTIDADCGPQGECFYGQCVDAAVAWHPVPPASMQAEISERVVHWATRFMGDRAAIVRADADWVAATLGLAIDAATPRSFWGGLSAQVVALRDSHTHLGAPYVGISTAFAVRPYSGSGPLDVCFGPTLDDLQSGALSYVIWATGPSAPGALMKGDLLTSIDGFDPKAWVDIVYPRYVSSLPIEPSADWAPSARQLATLIGQHASSITVTRCAQGVCTPQAPIDVAAFALAAIAGGQYSTGNLTCTPRFSDIVAGALSDSAGGDVVLSGALDASTAGIEFDGFSPTDAQLWIAQLDAALQLPHDNVMVDAREGFGGRNVLGRYLVQQFRSADAPQVLALAARASIDAADAAPLFSFDWNRCLAENDDITACDTDDIFIYNQPGVTPPALQSKVAWLNTDDVSNNDMFPRMLQGRANLRIFAPFATYGALGSNVTLPPLQSDWRTGSIAASDARYGDSITSAEAASSCESGHGVAPDEVVAQRLSDVFIGRDSIVAAAKAWLAQ